MNLNKILSMFPRVRIYDPLTQGQTINNELKGRSGVYLCYNTQTSDFYVGSSANLTQRLRSYRNTTTLKKSKLSRIYNAIVKYGLSSFKLLVLVDFPVCSKDFLLAQEQLFIDILKPTYNFLTKAGSSLGFKHSDETKTSMSTKKKGELNPNFGNSTPLSESHKANIAASKKGKRHSDITKAKMSAAQSGVKGSRYNSDKPVYLYTVQPQGVELVATFPNRNRASEFVGLSSSTVYRYAKARTLFEFKALSSILSLEPLG